MTPPHVVIAVRGGDDPKSRLAAVLGAKDRATLSLAMLRDMLDAVAESGAQAWVVTPDADLGRMPAGVRLIAQGDAIGLNGAFILGLEQVRAFDPSATVALLPGDLALLEPAELVDVLGTDAEIAAVQAADGGTGALVLRGGVDFTPLFGPDSFARHRRAALDRGLVFRQVEAASLAFDLDQPADIEFVLASGKISRAAAVLRAPNPRGAPRGDTL